MSEEFLACPRCACLKFYSHANEGKLIFFQVERAYRPVATDMTAEELDKVDLSTIYCAGCSWSGEMKDLD